MFRYRGSSAESIDLVVAMTLHPALENCFTNSKPMFLFDPVINTVDFSLANAYPSGADMNR